MDNDPEYTIAICSYNMEQTIKQSLRSILDQVDGEGDFEVLVVDDSTDSTPEILDTISEEYNTLRYIFGTNSNLAEARNQSFGEARGTYVLESLDVDDRYESCILDFVTVYRQIESQLDFEFFLKGCSINMAPRQLLLDIPYRSMGYGEDRDLWRRLFINDSIIWLDHEPFREPIGYEPDIYDRIQISFDMKIADFRSGISLSSYLRWCLDSPSPIKSAYYVLVGLPTFLTAVRRGRYGVQDRFSRMGELERTIKKESQTLADIECSYGLEINRDQLSPRGQEVFYENV